MKKIVFVTGSGGLVGSAVTFKLIKRGIDVHGIDINMRKKLFGKGGSVENIITELIKKNNYHHSTVDIRNRQKILDTFKEIKPNLIVHCASQPSHDWAATNPLLDFNINCNGTLNLLEAVRLNCPESLFVFLSTSKVFGCKINDEKYKELERRYEPIGPLKNGIDENYSVDQVNERSLFGSSKLAADIVVQEYGNYYKIPTVCLRCGCISGSNHAGVEQHGFLSYIIKCAKYKRPYTIFGYKGKQVRDNIHADDLSDAILELDEKYPTPGSVFNMGGGHERSCSVLEVIDILQKIIGEYMETKYNKQERRGDHKWYISCVKKFKCQYPNWKYQYSLMDTIEEIYNNC